MENLCVLLGIAGAIALGAASPGPSFILVSRTSIALSRADGLAAALGMGVGGFVYSLAAVLGLAAMLGALSWLGLILKVAGGAYLVYLACLIWRGASSPLAMQANPGAASRNLRRSFSVALVTQISNPKTAIIYASVFAALLPPAPPNWVLIALPPLMFAVDAGWYALVALAFSVEGPRAVYLRSKVWIDRAAGAIIGLLGIRLIIQSLQNL